MIVILPSRIRGVFTYVTMCVLGALALSAQDPRTSTGYDSLIDRAISSLQTGKFDEAARNAREAIALDPNRYEGHLYFGITRFRQDAVEEAEKSLRTALDRSPADRKDKVQEALDLVLNTRKFRELMAAAEEAERDGARAKAARTYAQVWWLGQNRLDIAAKALTGFIATSNHFEAARIWNTLTAKQKSDNAKLFAGIAINSREVSAEDQRRKPALQEAIKSDAYAQALELALPMGQAEPDAYAPIVRRTALSQQRPGRSAMGERIKAGTTDPAGFFQRSPNE